MIPPRVLIEELFARDIQLNPPATREALCGLEARLGYSLHPYILSVFEAFDGFAEGGFDQRSFIHVSSVAEIMACADAYPEAFADIALSAQMLGCSLGRVDDPVRDLDTGTVMAAGYADFWKKLVSNQLPF